MDQPLVKNANFATCLNRCLYAQKRLAIYIERHQETIKKFQIFDQSHGLTTCKKCKFCDLFKPMFVCSKKASYLYRTSPNTFSRRNVPNRKQ